MEFILKKLKQGVINSISLETLAKTLTIPRLTKGLDMLKAKIDKLEETPEVNKKNILDLIGSDFFKRGELIDISNAASIEKMKSISEGAIYYNKTKDAVRLKTKNGWVTLKTE